MLRLQHLVDGVRYLLEAHLYPLTHMGTRMHVVELVRRALHAPKIVGHGGYGEFPRFGLRCCRIQGVRRVGKDGDDACFSGFLMECSHIRRIDILRPSSPRVAGEELKGVRPDGCSLICHVGIAFGRGQMASYGEQPTTCFHPAFLVRPW